MLFLLEMLKFVEDFFINFIFTMLYKNRFRYFGNHINIFSRFYEVENGYYLGISKRSAAEEIAPRSLSCDVLLQKEKKRFEKF